MRLLAVAVVFASSVAAVEAVQPVQPAKPVQPVQAPAPKPAAPATPPSPGQQPPSSVGQQQPPPKPAGEAYTYDAENRRDPFISLVGTGVEAGVVKKGEGPPSMLTAEISVRGVMQSKGAYVAMIEGPDKKTYIVHSGDKLADGTIKSVMPTGLVIIQEINDPLSLVKQREVRKLLRSLEDAKE